MTPAARFPDHEYAMWDAAYVLGSLSESDRRAFEAHLDACASCQGSVAALSDMTDLLSRLGTDAVVAIDRAVDAASDAAGYGAADGTHRPPVTAEPRIEPTALPGHGWQARNGFDRGQQRSPHGPVAVIQDPETVFPIFRAGNYAPVPDELTAFDLPVEGSIPVDLNGWYLRNGPNPREAGGHWCTGDGMIHGVRLENGRAAWYRNRWVRTDSFDDPFPPHHPDGSRNLHASVANTHVLRHAGRTLALMEFSLPYEITNDLETLGAYDFGGKLTDSMTAHPKICPATGEMHFFGYGNIFDPHIGYYRADSAGELTVHRPIEVRGLTLMHDFALTAEHVVFMDLPVVFDLGVALAHPGLRDLPYRWDERYEARLGVLRRADPYGPIRWFPIDPCYVFHVANAFDVRSDGRDRIAVQVVRYPEMWRGSSDFETDATLWNWTIDLDAGRVAETQIDDREVEFPRVDDRLVGAAARYPVVVGGDGLIRYDLKDNTSETHRFGAGTQRGAPAEAVFAAAPGDLDESAGWYLTYVYDPVRDGSDLVIIDASDFAGKPVARVQLPRRVPHGFHGNWLPD